MYELLNKYSNEQIIEGLKSNYDDVNENGYTSALKELREIEPSKYKQENVIVVEMVKDGFSEDGEEEYLSCDGKGLDEEGNMIRWGLEFDTWDNWLAEDIDEDCFNKLDEITILVGIIWEMTYNGYTQKQRDIRKDELVDRQKESEEHPENLLTLDEVKNNLKVDYDIMIFDSLYYMLQQEEMKGYSLIRVEIQEDEEFGEATLKTNDGIRKNLFCDNRVDIWDFEI